MTTFDEAYAEVPDLFGAGPDDVLKGHVHRIPPGAHVLDIGAGQGRHALYLARRGMNVHALDPSRVGLEIIARAAEEEALPVTTSVGGFKDVPCEGGEYDVVLLFGLIQLLTWEEIRDLESRIYRWLRPGGFLFATAWTTQDSGFERNRQQSQQVGVNSFRLKDGELRTFLEPGQLPFCFRELEVMHLEEALGPEHRHGDGPLERHARVEAVLQKARVE